MILFCYKEFNDIYILNWLFVLLGKDDIFVDDGKLIKLWGDFFYECLVLRSMSVLVEYE